MEKNKSSWLWAGIFIALLSLVVSHQASAATPALQQVSTGEDYKSYHPDHRFTLGVSGGLGLVDTSGGFTLIGNAATQIVKSGFIPDIVNPVFLEVEFGPLFTSGTTVWMYSTHLRWDFVKDQDWTFFAIGGFGGNIVTEKIGDRVAFHPRFGVGAFYHTGAITWRGEFSHEIITVGISFPL